MESLKTKVGKNISEQKYQYIAGRPVINRSLITNPYMIKIEKEKDLISEILIPELNIENFKSRQSAVFQVILDEVLCTFLAYPSLNCNINIVDLNLDNKHIKQLSKVNYFSTLSGHKRSITEINYYKDKFQEPLMTSCSIEGRVIMWLQINPRIIEPKFLNEVNVKVHIFEKYKIFNYDVRIDSIGILDKSYFPEESFLENGILEKNTPMIVSANENNLYFTNLNGEIISDICTDGNIHDNYIISIIKLNGSYSNHPFIDTNNMKKNYSSNLNNNINTTLKNESKISFEKEKTDRKKTNISNNATSNDVILDINELKAKEFNSKRTFFKSCLITGSKIGNGLRVLSIEDNLINNFSERNNDIVSLTNIASIKIDADVTTIFYDEITEIIYLSTGLGEVLMLKLIPKVKRTKVNIKEKENPLLTLNPVESLKKEIKINSKFDQNNSGISNSNLNNNNPFSNRLIPNFSNNNIMPKEENYYTVTYTDFELKIIKSTKLQGSIFMISPILKNLNVFGFCLDKNNSDIFSDNGFGLILNKESHLEEYIFSDIFHKSYIFHFDVLFENNLQKNILITVGLDKMIKIKYYN